MNKGQYRISVKREDGGRASNHLHDQLHVGSSIQLFPPSGEFTLTDSDKPLKLISGGVGIILDPGHARSGAGNQAAGAFYPLRTQWQCSRFPRLDRWIRQERHLQLKRFIATTKMTASARQYKQGRVVESGTTGRVVAATARSEVLPRA